MLQSECQRLQVDKLPQRFFTALLVTLTQDTTLSHKAFSPYQGLDKYFYRDSSPYHSHHAEYWKMKYIYTSQAFITVYYTVTACEPITQFQNIML